MVVDCFALARHTPSRQSAVQLATPSLSKAAHPLVAVVRLQLGILHSVSPHPCGRHLSVIVAVLFPAISFVSNFRHLANAPVFVLSDQKRQYVIQKSIGLRRAQHASLDIAKRIRSGAIAIWRSVLA